MGFREVEVVTLQSRGLQWWSTGETDTLLLPWDSTAVWQQVIRDALPISNRIPDSSELFGLWWERRLARLVHLVPFVQVISLVWWNQLPAQPPGKGSTAARGRK